MNPKATVSGTARNYSLPVFAYVRASHFNRQLYIYVRTVNMPMVP